MKKIAFLIQIMIIACSLSCAATSPKNLGKPAIITGADQTSLYINYLKGKNIGMVINQTSVIGKNKVLSLDTLLKLGISIKKIYGPEHGFRGDASNGASSVGPPLR